MFRRRTGGLAGGTVVAEPVAALQLDGVSRAFGEGVRALDDVTLRIPVGRFVAVMGRSGSGKSTLLQCAAGLDRPTSGRVRIGGRDLSGLNEATLTRVRRDRVGFVFQALNLVPSLTVLENAGLPLLLAGQEGPWEEEALRALGAVGLAGRAGDSPARLSGGQQQRVAIAPAPGPRPPAGLPAAPAPPRALVTEPAVVFADEPTGALDPVTAADVLALLRAAVDERGRTVVMVTHDPVAAQWADEAVFLHEGRLVDRVERPEADHVCAVLRELGNAPGSGPWNRSGHRSRS
ncbi:ABC transporter ATP-binding protein [Streptomyces sp. N35]|uniref:ABC transporter ATP-binding protein n=1 Tax=Streptomyces sp. N35 TaxID=2795730 RepID=UPI0018F70C20|nr:ABC transporter ATP-binding protein [Streptomyces sp. N35]